MNENPLGLARVPMISVYFAAVLLGSAPLCEAGDSPQADALVAGILARSQAVFSGRMRYHYESGFRDTGKIIESDERELSFYGLDWALQIPDQRITRASHGGKFVEFIRHRQPDGSLHDVADVFNPKPINYFDYPDTPVDAGTLWWQQTRTFVRDNARKAKLVERTNVNGVEVEGVEWAVTKAERNAFKSLGEDLLNGGTLRVFVAPQLGYALPRILYIGMSGRVSASFDCSSFEEVAAGVFLPHKCGAQFFQNRVPTCYVQFNITGTEKINEPIPEQDFIIQLPVGTIVGDSRSGKGSTIFTIEKAGVSLPVSDLSDIISIGPIPGKARYWPWFAVGIGVSLGIGLVIVCTTVLGRRRVKR
jgi:hypothetical protein